ncbi:hypothetical protein [Corallococcus macrosporus]|uniref:Lipoprotein n=1 Tax=Corallococcus macrosporus DSM 14697 TaxID=1189310 RepID=A0A250JMS1_9BACT|nr:hypothetical protein [Corallococcus macrosporus]ATB45155.1 hypothetical protein MYMAC_000739 [Corallococcus macrosporus DSM 14697]
MRSLKPVFSSAVVMALCSLLAGACGGSPADDTSPDTQAPQSGGLGGKGSEGVPAWGDEPTYPGDGETSPDKVTICHIPPGNPANAHSITVSVSAWPAHERHGDTLGPCDGGTGGEPDAGSGEEPGGEEPGGEEPGGEEPDAGGGEEPVCGPIGADCGESAACCFGLTCGESNTCEPTIG